MRWGYVFFCFVFLAFIFAGTSAPLDAADLKSPHQSYSDDRSDYDDDGPTYREVAEYCGGQRYLCRKICRLRFREAVDEDGCKQTCERRATRCTRTGCYRWTEPDFLIAEKFGGYKCVSG